MERTKTLKGGKDAETEGNRTPESAKGVCARTFAKMKDAVGEGLSEMAKTVAKGTLIATLAVGTACTGPVGDEPEEDADGGGGWVINRPGGPGLEIDFCARNPAACPHPDAGEEVLDAESEGTEVDTEAGVACEGAEAVPVSEYNLLAGTPVNVGGYSITYDVGTMEGIEIDVACGSSGAPLVDNQAVPLDGTVVIPARGNMLEIVVQLEGRNYRVAIANISVETSE